MKKIGLLAALAIAWTARAQEVKKDTTLTRTVVVEHEYAPEIEDARKINVLPPVEQPAISQKTVEYDLQLRPTTPAASTIDLFDAPDKMARPLPGYVRAGMGNMGKMDLTGHYHARIGEADRLRVEAGFEGLKGDGKWGDGTEWNRHEYRTRAALGYEHDFRGMTLDASASLGLRNFNVLSPFDREPGTASRNQRFTSGGLHIGLGSTDEGRDIRFRGETNLMFYNRAHEVTVPDIGETWISTRGDLNGALSGEGQRIGIALQMDNYFYNQELIENRTDLCLNPYFSLESGNWRVRAGIKTDWALGSGKQFYMAPDLYASYQISKSGLLYAQVTGGKQANHFRRLEAANPYLFLGTEAPRSTYEQVNAALGVRVSPTPGLWMHFYGGFQELKDDLCYLSKVDEVSGNEVTSRESTDDRWQAEQLWAQGKTRNFYGGGEFLYDYRDQVKLSLSAIYRSWKDVKEQGLLYHKPQLDLHARLTVKPVAGWEVNVGFHYQKREEQEESLSNGGYEWLKAKPVSDLYASATYRLLNNASLYAKAGNLLNKKYEYYWRCPAEGFNLLGGIIFHF